MIEDIFRSFEKFRIPYCVLHGWESLPDFLPSDLDIAVSPESLTLLENALSAVKGAEIVQLLIHEASCFYFVIAFNGDRGYSFISVDAATDYRLKGHVFFTSEELLAGRRKHRSFWVASPYMELKYLVTKKIMKESLTEEQAGRIIQLTKVLGENGRSTIADILGKKAANEFLTRLNGKGVERKEINFRELKKALLKHGGGRGAIGFIKYRAAEIVRVLKRVFYPTGIIVAVLGPDGSGKSTFIRNIMKANLSPFRRSDYFHLRPGILGRKKTEKSVTSPHCKPPRSAVVSFLKIIYFIVDYFLGFFLKVKPLLIRSSLIFFDRYFDDLLVDPKRYRFKGSLGIVKGGRHFIPKPDLYIIIDVPAETLLERKQEIAYEELVKQRERYRKLFCELPNSVFLDGTKSADFICEEGKSLILKFLGNRYKERRKIWFGSATEHSLKDFFSSVYGRETLTTGAVTAGEKKFALFSIKDGRRFILPMGNRKFSAKGLELYQPQKLKALAAKKSAVFALKAGLKVPCLKRLDISPSHYPRSAYEGSESFTGHLCERLGEYNLTLSASLGTPGVHQKPVFQILSGKGSILGYAKLSLNGSTRKLVKNEAETLKDISGIPFTAFEVSKILLEGHWKGNYYCVQTPPGGRTTPSNRKLNGAYLNVLREIGEATCINVQLTDSPLIQSLAAGAEIVKDERCKRLFSTGIEKAERALAGHHVAFGLIHGDFTPWNCYKLPGKLFIYDWEYSSPRGPLLWDLFHFIIRTGSLVFNKDPDKIYRSIKHGVTLLGKGVSESYSCYYDSNAADAMLILFLLEKAILPYSDHPVMTWTDRRMMDLLETVIN